MLSFQKVKEGCIGVCRSSTGPLVVVALTDEDGMLHRAAMTRDEARRFISKMEMAIDEINMWPSPPERYCDVVEQGYPSSSESRILA